VNVTVPAGLHCEQLCFTMVLCNCNRRPISEPRRKGIILMFCCLSCLIVFDGREDVTSLFRTPRDLGASDRRCRVIDSTRWCWRH